MHGIRSGKKRKGGEGMAVGAWSSCRCVVAPGFAASAAARRSSGLRGSLRTRAVGGMGGGAGVAHPAMPPHLFVPSDREARYGKNVARYLLEMGGTQGATFNFCGGMMFGLVLSDALTQHLEQVADAGEGHAGQPRVYPASVRRMSQMPDGYARDAAADNVRVFHGREVRQVPDAAGGMGMAIHLSLAGQNDPEGWTPQEVDEYSGWLSDRQRRWRNADLLTAEGFDAFPTKFGPEAFTLHHRFYLHLDQAGGLWLSAEDGCEGVAQPSAPKTRSPLSLFGL